MAQPNIILILIDDMGWTDLGCYNSSFYETPNIDRLAAAGMRFTDAYAACPVCSPTRASLLTGKYPATIGVTNYIDWSGKAHPARGRLIDVPYVHELPIRERTIASVLHDAGYATWHIGKWHLGGVDTYPDRHGFDVNIGGWEVGYPDQGYFSPWGLPTLEDGPEGEFLTDRLTDEAVKLIRHKNDNHDKNDSHDSQPFFLNLWYYTVHTPLQAKPEKIAKYEAKAKALGLDKIQAIEEGDFFPCEHKKEQRIQRRRVQSHPIYAAMIESLDENVGRLLQAVEDAGEADNTIVIFTSDNGGLATSEGSPTCNAPLAEGKGWMYEGGTREPLLICWPGVVEPASVCTTPLTSPDFFPTLLDIAGLDSMPELHVDGNSFAPLLRGEPQPDRGPIFWHYPHYGNQGGTPGSSVRDGDYKLIEFFEDGRLELYNLRQDIGENHNLVDEQPEEVARLQRLLAEWREGIEAKIPQPNPAYVPWR